MKPRIGLAQIEIFPGQPGRNTATMIDWINQARTRDLDLIAFPEMAVPGYLVGDEWENDAFVRDCLACNEALRQASRGICVVWGSLDADFSKKGDDGRTRKYNAAFIARDGIWLENGILAGRTYKTLLPAYREFEDKRHFFSMDRWAAETGHIIGDALQPFRIGKSTRVGLMLCEDMWDNDYALKPGRILQGNGADFLINLSCSPWTWRKNDKRHRVAKGLIGETKVPLYYVNAVGMQNNGKDIYALDGGSTIYDADGGIIAMQPAFSEAILTALPTPPTTQPIGPTGSAAQDFPASSPDRDIAETCLTLVQMIRRWFAANGNPPVVIGLSGGIDSALVATLLAMALGPRRVWAINMPSRFNSNTTKNAARGLAANLGIHYSVIPIEESAAHTIHQVESADWEIPMSTGPGRDHPLQVKHLTLSGLNRENIQARDRGGRILAAVASALGGVFTNNGNKTETALGYATLYGDINGAFAPIGDLYKTQVYALCRFINESYQSGSLVTACGPGPEGDESGWVGGFTALPGDSLIPRAILEVVPSAELSAAQNVDEGKGDPIRYDYHDALLYQFIDGGFQPGMPVAYGRRDPADILQWYADGEIDRRLGIAPGTTAGYFPDLPSFILDLEEKWTLYKRSTFKRIQSPPIFALSKRAFGFDLRESINGAYLSLPYRQLRDQMLGIRTQPEV